MGTISLSEILQRRADILSKASRLSRLTDDHQSRTMLGNGHDRQRSPVEGDRRTAHAYRELLVASDRSITAPYGAIPSMKQQSELSVVLLASLLAAGAAMAQDDSGLLGSLAKRQEG